MEKINLSKETISDLFKNNLVLIDDQSSDKLFAPAPNTAVSHTGGYQKKILWIHEASDHPSMSDEDHEMITKILEACKLSWLDIALINIFGVPVPAENLIMQYSPDYLIISVPEKTDLHKLAHNLYSVVKNDEMSILATDRLGTIRNDKNLKIKLWQSLKQIFEL